MPVFYDQLNRAITLAGTPKRIISLVPSQTELLFFMGMDNEIVGITKFCIHPDTKVSLIAKIGGTKQLNLEAIHNLRPDLIIANKEENEQSQVEELMKHYPVWVSNINNLPDALDMIRRVGAMFDKKPLAESLTFNITRQFETIKISLIQMRVAYLIWRKPYMAAGQHTFINNMLQICGFTNAIDAERYPVVTNDELIATAPEVLLLPSEPYPFTQKHINEFKAILPNTRVILVNGEMFSWYGSRLVHAPGYFKELIEKVK